MDKEDERRSSIETNGLTQKSLLNFLLEGGDEFSLYSAHIYCTRKTTKSDFKPRRKP